MAADGRLFMFIVSFQTFIDNLWIGIGTGGYLHSLGEGIIRYFEENPESVFKATVGVADHSFCEPLRIAVEQGVIGVSLFMSIIMYAIWKMVKIDSPITYGIITLFFFSCFSYAFSIVPMCILFTVFLALSGSGTARVQWRVRNVGKIVIILPTIGVLLFASHQLQCRFDASRDLDRFSMYMDEVFISDYYELLPEIDDKVNYLYKFAELLRHSGRHNDSNHILRLATNISADPMLHIIMGRNYEDMKCYDLADEKYERAYMMQPNRIYPLYRQMKMYETSNDDRLRDKVQQVYSFSPKVKSAATQEIKQEACQILITIESQIDL
ncbi:MAG: O-antigen ligase family protein [Bacteroidales bacterium]|nr:O-antigen ligase family protein [Bacteroidales bacterium]